LNPRGSVQPPVHLVLVVVQLLFASLAVAGRYVLPRFPAGALVNLVAGYIYLQPLFAAAVAPLVLDGEHLTQRAVAAGLLIFAGLGLVILAELRQHRQIPLEPVGE
jgi:drug/metabolite transporter (DMT)-like permease